jgi:hypothetical protein
MSYIRTSSLGYTGVTSYGTIQEAQEYVADEFDLPYYPPAAVVMAPISPKKRPWWAYLMLRRREVLR